MMDGTYTLAPDECGNPPDVLEDMPGMRARLNPELVPMLAQWLIAQSRQYDRASTMTLRGLKGVRRARRKGQILYARRMLHSYERIIAQLSDTVDRHALNEVRAVWDAATAPVEGATNGD